MISLCNFLSTSWPPNVICFGPAHHSIWTKKKSLEPWAKINVFFLYLQFSHRNDESNKYGNFNVFAEWFYVCHAQIFFPSGETLYCMLFWRFVVNHTESWDWLHCHGNGQWIWCHSILIFLSSRVPSTGLSAF